MRILTRALLVFVALCLTAGAVRAQSLDIPLNFALENTTDRNGAVLIINVGIGGAAPQPYLFDTGSSFFVANATQGAFGSVPTSMSGEPTGLKTGYADGVEYTYNLVGVPSLTFYPSSTSTNGGVTLNAVSPSGSASQFLIGAVTNSTGSFPEGALPGVFNGDNGIFGASNFLSSLVGPGYTATRGPGSPLGQAIIPGTTSGYVVAANGQPLSAINGGNVGPYQQYVSSPNGPQVGQSVTSCSPCVMLGLTPALIAQFMPANLITTHHDPADGTFANSGAPATIESAYFLNITSSSPGQPTVTVSSRSLLDTGTSFYFLSTGIPTANYANGGQLTISGPANGATTTTVTLINNSDPAACCNPYYALSSSDIGDGSESTIGLPFFLNNSVLFNLAGQAVGYTSNFVTDVDIATTSASPLVIDSNSVPLGLAGIISGNGALQVVNGGSATLSGTNTYTGPTTVNNGGFLALVGPGSISASSGVSVSSGGIFDISGVGGGSPTAAYITSLSSTDSAGFVLLGANQLVLTNASGTFAGTIGDGGLYGGTGGSLLLAGGTETLTGANVYTGGTIVVAGTLQMSGAGTLGATTGTTTLLGGVLDLGHTTQTQAALYLAGGTLQNGSLDAPITSTGGVINDIGGTASLTTTSGFTFILGANTYTGGTSVNGGVLDVIGSITDPTVNAGGLLMGSGTVGTTQVNAGGIFAPGNGTAGSSMNVSGNLAFQSGALYLLLLNQTSSLASVTGSATLGGAIIDAVYGSYVSKRYAVLTAGSVSGTFGSLVNANLPANFTSSLSYDAHDAYLNLTLGFGSGASLNPNQQKIANALTNFFNANGGIPAVYGTLTPTGLTQASGEAATGSQQTTFNAMNQFMGVMTDPFVAGRGDGSSAGGGATGYADEANAYAAKRNPNDALAAIYTKARPVAPYDPRWSTWVAGFGGSQNTDGNVVTGSNSTTSTVAGTAVGADYRFSPFTIAGFALAGGGTSFSVNGSGSGHSDLFQVGAFVRHDVGPAYVLASLAYGWQDITTNRTVTIAGSDQLRAEFNANAFSGRLEGGYRFVTPYFGGVGITPYAAGQFTTFDLPSYAEAALSGSGAFALSYNSQSVTDARSELGIRTDKSYAVQGGIFTLRGRFAWAHDYDPDRSVAATFQALPGASFVVNGATQAADSALTTASAEMKWTNNWSVAATFEGEFSDVTRSYAGKGVVRYTW
jgi:autotransporter-associated beta strand protein